MCSGDVETLVAGRVTTFTPDAAFTLSTMQPYPHGVITQKTQPVIAPPTSMAVQLALTRCGVIASLGGVRCPVVAVSTRHDIHWTCHRNGPVASKDEDGEEEEEEEE